MPKGIATLIGRLYYAIANSGKADTLPFESTFKNEGTYVGTAFFIKDNLIIIAKKERDNEKD